MLPETDLPSAAEVERNAAQFAECVRCKRQVELFHHWRYFDLVDGIACFDCVWSDAIKLDPSINPLPDHMHALVEPYIQWREGQAVAKFLLQTIEDQGVSRKTNDDSSIEDQKV